MTDEFVRNILLGIVTGQIVALVMIKLGWFERFCEWLD